MMFANRIGSSTSCSIWLPETSPPSSARDLLGHRFQSCNTSAQSASSAPRLALARRAPRVSSEVRHLIAQMARENFLWGAPRIHGELLMLGFSVSQATMSRYLFALGRRPTQSWRTFLRNQASAFSQY